MGLVSLEDPGGISAEGSFRSTISPSLPPCKVDRQLLLPKPDLGGGTGAWGSSELDRREGPSRTLLGDRGF